MAETFEDIVTRLLELHRTRNSGYENSPMNILPVSDWLSQIVIKAVRAQQSKTTEKKIEELEDNIVYSIMAIIKLQGGEV